MSKVLVDRELLAGVCSMVPEKMKAARKELRAILAQPAEAEGVEAVAWLHRQGNHTEAADRPLTEYEEARGWEQDELLTVTQHLAALSAVTAERDAANSRLHEVAVACATAEQERDQLRAEVERLRDAAGKAIAWLDAEQNGSGVGINRRLKLCRDAENSLRAAMAAKEA